MNLENYPVYAAIYKLNLDCLPRLAKFPRPYRGLLAERISSQHHELMELCTEAIFSAPSRQAVLRSCNIRLEVLRVLWRTARDLGAISFRGYGFILNQLDSIGRMIGGWLHSLSGSISASEAFS